MIPWKYHNLTPRDISGKLIRQWNHQKAFTPAVGQLLNGITVPQDNAAVILKWSHSVQGGAGQGPLYGRMIIVQNPNTGGVNEIFSDWSIYLQNSPIVSGGLTIGFISQACNGIVVGPGCGILMEANFVAGANANQGYWSLGAVLIPVGDMAYL